jgi:hypothetical protein
MRQPGRFCETETIECASVAVATWSSSHHGIRATNV